MKKLSLLFLMLLIYSSTSAQIDPDPDGIGLYFDQGATSNCELVPVYTAFDLYLCLTRPSWPNGIGGWEIEIPTNSSPGLVYIGDELLQRGYSVQRNPEEFMVAYMEPLPPNDVVVLLTTSWYLLEPGRFEFFLKPLYDPSLPDAACYADWMDPRILIPMHPSSGSWDLPVAVVNGDCDVVAIESVSWGSVKALYGVSGEETSP